MINFETLSTWIQRTGMCLEESADYLGNLTADSEPSDCDAVYQAALQGLISQIDMRVIKALELKKIMTGSDFLREIGSWEWPYPSVERRFYEYLFAKMA